MGLAILAYARKADRLIEVVEVNWRVLQLHHKMMVSPTRFESSAGWPSSMGLQHNAVSSQWAEQLP